MPSVSSMIAFFWINLQISLPLQIFMCSLVTLACCLLLLAWRHAVHLSLFDDISLKDIEYTHPHVPSLRAIVTVFLCSIALFITALPTVGATTFFNGPYEILYLAGIFAVGAAVNILAEIRWKGVTEYSFAFIIGTALAFICIALVSITSRNWITFSALLALLAVVTFLAWRVLYVSWGRRAKIFFILSFGVWLILYFAGF